VLVLGPAPLHQLHGQTLTQSWKPVVYAYAVCVPFADRAEARFVPDPARR
jgi:hypothetical protein